ncbi:MAG: hypothetical protein IKL68_00865 [Clostridia bacterium]|nr:hypothetical protein [Clostridia bacterium]
MKKYSLGNSGVFRSRFKSAVAAVFSPSVRRERARRDGFRPDILDEEVRNRYYDSKLTIEDVIRYNLYDDISATELEYNAQQIAKRIGIHNLANIDIEAYSYLGYKMQDMVEESELTRDSSAEEIKAVIVAGIEESLEHRYTREDRYTKLTELAITRDNLPRYIVEFPEGMEELKEAFLSANLTLEQVNANRELFAGKRWMTRLNDDLTDFVERYGLTEEKYEYIITNMPELLDSGILEMVRASKSIDSTLTPEENKEKIAEYYIGQGITSANAKVALNYASLQELLKESETISAEIRETVIPKFLQEVDEKTLIEYIPIEVMEQKDAWRAFNVMERFGITPIMEFERENGPIFSSNGFANMKYIDSAYLHYAGNRGYDSPANLYIKPDGAGDRPYTREEFNEVMRRIIIYGPSDGTAKVKLDCRMLQGPFRDANPDLFIAQDAPQELQDKFYKTGIKLEDIEEHPEYRRYLSDVNLDMCLERPNIYFEGQDRDIYSTLEGIFGKEDLRTFLMDNARTIKYLNKRRDYLRMTEPKSLEELQGALKRKVEMEILSRGIKYGEDAPDFFKEAHPEMFLSPDAPEELKLAFYDDYLSKSERYQNYHSSNYNLTFKAIGEHREWAEFLKGKNIPRAMPSGYFRLFELLGLEQAMKLSGRSGESLDKMVGQHKEETLSNWYKATGGKFVPHHTVMLNFPESEMDNFLMNGKKWSALARVDRFNFNDEGKTATLKLAYVMGVFNGNDAGFKKVTDMLTLPPSHITAEDYEKAMAKFADNPEKLALLQEAYVLGEDGKYTYRPPKIEQGEGINQKEAKKLAEGKVQDIRLALEKADVSTVLTPTKAHQMFDSFDMRYDPKFVDFFMKHQEEIMSNPDYVKDIALIQRRFPEIIRDNAGRTLTLELAAEYIRNNNYENVDIGNEGLAEQAKIAGYSQRDYDKLQEMYNEGEMRDYSSIPRVTGERDGYTYEMLRCDDPLALSIGTLTDCCQEIGGAGQTSMEHSVLSKDGRVFVVRDTEGRIVAQSWFWRNQYTGCFDNIEIPNKIFTTYEKEHPEEGRSGLTKAVLGVYKQATLDLMREDERVYSELLEAGTITQEQYDALRLGKVTIGLGYNDIKDAIQSDSDMHKDTAPRHVIEGGRVPHPYTDAREQYVITEREGIVESTYQNLQVHEDTIPVYDGTNLPATTVIMMKKMEKAAGKDDLEYVTAMKDGMSKPSEELITSVAREYYINPNTTKIAATSRMAIVYSAEDVGPVKMASMLTAPLREGMSEEEQKQFAEHTDFQLKKALRQITANGKRILDTDSLPEADRLKVGELLAVIKKENEERGPRE